MAWAAAIANLEVFEEEKMLDKLQTKIEHFKQRLQSFTALDNVGDVRQCGIMVGIELIADKDTKECFPSGARIGHRVIKEARNHGLIIRPLGDVIVLMPPLSISIDELDRLCDITYESIRAVTERSNIRH